MPHPAPRRRHQGRPDRLGPADERHARLGTWNPQSGYGLINAVKAINAVDVLRVESTNPASGSTVLVTPGAITVTFNKPVNFSSVIADPNPSDILSFVTTPTGVKVNLGAPIAVDDPTHPTIIQFPFSLSKPVGTIANGSYSFDVQNPPAPYGPITTADGSKDFVPGAAINFTLADVTAPMRRDIGLRPARHDHLHQGDRPQHDHAGQHLRPASQRRGSPVNLNTVLGTNGSLATISSSLNSAGQTVVTLDYRALPQTAMPTDSYDIIVSGSVTDLVGNDLDGNFSGSFPSGDGMPGSKFDQPLGLQTLGAPRSRRSR